MTTTEVICVFAVNLLWWIAFLILDRQNRRLHAALQEIDTLQRLLLERESSEQPTAANSRVTPQSDRE